MGEQTRGNVITLRGRSVEPLRPPRLTFARRCVWCGEPDCQHSDCVALHEVSVWAVCRQCDGTGLAFSGPQGCTCAFGLIHVAPAVQRVLYTTRRGEVVTEQGHWSSYNDRTYHAFLHPEEEVKRVSAAGADSEQVRRLTAADPLDMSTGEVVAL